MISHWFLKEEHTKFRNCIMEIIDTVADEVCRYDSRDTLGDEHDQCQYLFTKMYTLMQERRRELTKNLLCCSKIKDPVVEIRYYRSRVKRTKTSERPQFIESETGADFALAIEVDLPGVIQVSRSILGQAKIIDNNESTLIDKEQLDNLIETAGPESAAYILWGSKDRPTVLSANNVSAYLTTNNSLRINSSTLSLGMKLSEFFCESFLSLWFGKDYNSEKEGENPPKKSIPVLYHFLHRGNTPPNVIFFGISSGNKLGLSPGVYIDKQTDIP